MKRCVYHRTHPLELSMECDPGYQGPCDLGHWGIDAVTIEAAPAMLAALTAIVSLPLDDEGDIILPTRPEDGAITCAEFNAAVEAIVAATPPKPKEDRPMQDAILVDIDGTLANIEHRLKYIAFPRSAQKDWSAFFDAMVDDKPIEATCKLVRTLIADSTYPGATAVIFVTGRPNSHRQMTANWLIGNDLGGDHHGTGKLYMRKAGDHRPDTVVKREILEHIKTDGFNPTIAIDDRKSVVDMWREEGLICLQAAEGDF